MREPYQGEEEYSGYSTMKTEEVENAVKLAAKTQMQLLAHCNGDKACEQYIEAISTSIEIQKLRPVMIHAQLLGLDQLRLVKQYGIIPSFFIAHTYYWGDVHLKNFGEDRARAISPAGSSLAEDILFTFHQDSPVIEPDMLETIWCAIERKTKEGIELAKEERISVLEAIKAVTCNVAYQYGEEKQKGTIEVEKLADFVILDQNPLTSSLDQIKTIQVLETIKEGKTLWHK
jgi:predicted amidohydrolase YtcJ